MQRVVFVLIGVMALSLVAFGLSEATMAVGHRNGFTAGLWPHASALPKVVTSPSPSPSSSVSPLALPSAAPVATPTPAPLASPSVIPTATTVSFVHMRAGASTATPIVVDLDGGAVVTLGAYVDSQWQQVTYNGQNGYIFKTYLRY